MTGPQHAIHPRGVHADGAIQTKCSVHGLPLKQPRKHAAGKRVLRGGVMRGPE